MPVRFNGSKDIPVIELDLKGEREKVDANGSGDKKNLSSILKKSQDQTPENLPQKSRGGLKTLAYITTGTIGIFLLSSLLLMYQYGGKNPGKTLLPEGDKESMSRNAGNNGRKSDEKLNSEKKIDEILNLAIEIVKNDPQFEKSRRALLGNGAGNLKNALKKTISEITYAEFVTGGNDTSAHKIPVLSRFIKTLETIFGANSFGNSVSDLEVTPQVAYFLFKKYGKYLVNDKNFSIDPDGWFSDSKITSIEEYNTFLDSIKDDPRALIKYLKLSDRVIDVYTLDEKRGTQDGAILVATLLFLESLRIDIERTMELESSQNQNIALKLIDSRQKALMQGGITDDDNLVIDKLNELFGEDWLYSINFQDSFHSRYAGGVLKAKASYIQSTINKMMSLDNYAPDEFITVDGAYGDTTLAAAKKLGFVYNETNLEKEKIVEDLSSWLNERWNNVYEPRFLQEVVNLGNAIENYERELETAKTEGRNPDPKFSLAITNGFKKIMSIQTRIDTGSGKELILMLDGMKNFSQQDSITSNARYAKVSELINKIINDRDLKSFEQLISPNEFPLVDIEDVKATDWLRTLTAIITVAQLNVKTARSDIATNLKENTTLKGYITTGWNNMIARIYYALFSSDRSRLEFNPKKGTAKVTVFKKEEKKKGQ